MAAQGKRKTYVNLGVVLSNDKGGSYILVDDKVDLVVNGIKFTGKFINLNSPADKYKFMAEKGKITSDEAAEKIANISPKVKKDVVIVLE